jgi:heat shock protein HslJ/uncharacterized membrane protein
MKDMKKQALFGFLLLTIMGCKSLDDRMENADIDAETYSENTYFKASGNDPFWSLEIENDSIKLKSSTTGTEIFKIASVNPSRAEDNDVKMYQINNKAVEMNIQITKGNCENSTTGVISPYYVTTVLKRKTDSKPNVFSGCGKYILDRRLNDTWVLEQLNGKKMSRSDFQNEMPRLEINTGKNHFTGYAGCNQISGSIFFEKDVFRFSNITSTKMMCKPQNKEPQFLKILQSATIFAIEDNKLLLSNATGNQMVFKKSK